MKYLAVLIVLFIGCPKPENPPPVKKYEVAPEPKEVLLFPEQESKETDDGKDKFVTGPVDMDLYVIYDNPTDHPNKFVVRVWKLKGEPPKTRLIPGGIVSVKDTLEDARKAVPEGWGRMSFPGLEDPVIKETWAKVFGQ